MRRDSGQTSASVVLMGCGNIGFRHLQALASMAIPVQIFIIEPVLALHPRIQALIGEESAKGRHRFALAASLAEAGVPAEVGLAVIATGSLHRRAAWEDLCAVTRPAAVIFEKVLFTTLRDLDEVGARLARQGIAGYVNCGRRGFADYHRLQARFASTGIPVDLAVAGSSYGLASNLVHFLDLAEFLNQAELVSLDFSGLEPATVSSKRGDYIEIFGRVEGRLSNGARFSAFCENREGLEIGVTLQPQGGAVLRLDERAGTLSEAGAVTPFGIRFVSGMPDLYEGLFQGRGSALTPYAASARQHRIYLNALRPWLGLSNATDDPCPVS
ncbi:hypothetical protein [Pseudogemmobacter faecipullorum]|uniref:Gfo/Idh/MocA-like oxidoreductase N-terminal domain-containing protein n=1 Tax=Pseudogemmobacter faecipullorum TaxID=2755041 RepID=A0ABS8CGE4_9RHOB|nr:hypothetical protein [Pseudogemmobacter faecipullorum]MCB5408445.1 hypothetical protein [Pseudogemmobacter faecipullorum]